MNAFKKAYRILWWKYVPGTVFNLKWPRGKILTNASETVYSSDPNDFYRSDLERLVGKQLFNWDWRNDPDSNLLEYGLQLKIRKGKEDGALVFAMIHGAALQN